MTGIDDLHDSLQTMNFVQLLLAFTALMSYAVAQGRLVGPRGRGWAWTLAFLSAAAFCVYADAWEHGALLAALAVVAIGLFAAIVWSVSRLLGVDRNDAVLASSSAFGEVAETEPVTVSPPLAADSAGRSSPRAEPVHST